MTIPIARRRPPPPSRRPGRAPAVLVVHAGDLERGCRPPRGSTGSRAVTPPGTPAAARRRTGRTPPWPSAGNPRLPRGCAGSRRPPGGGCSPPRRHDPVRLDAADDVGPLEDQRVEAELSRPYGRGEPAEAAADADEGAGGGRRARASR